MLGRRSRDGGRASVSASGSSRRRAAWGSSSRSRDARSVSAAYPAPLPVAEVAELVGLEESRGARVRTLSGGQRRRLDLALAIAGDPECSSSTSRRPASTPRRDDGRGSWSRACVARQDDLADDPLHGRGAEPRRPGSGHRPRPHRRRGRPAMLAGARTGPRSSTSGSRKGSARTRPAAGGRRARGRRPARQLPHRIRLAH